jgi:hypothetical protein
MFSKHAHVLAVLSSLSCSGYLSDRLVQSDLSRLSCPSCLVQDVLSRPSWHVLAVLVPVALPRQLWSTTLLTPVLCSGSPFQAHLSRLTSQAVLSWLSCPSFERGLHQTLIVRTISLSARPNLMRRSWQFLFRPTGWHENWLSCMQLVKCRQLN